MLNLPRDEMAFRRIYKDLLEQEKLWVIFRPGKRTCEDFRGYYPAQKVRARVLKNIGADWANVAPEFIEGFSKTIEIRSVEVRTIGSLKLEDFEGSSPDVRDRDSLIYHLGLIYNLEKRDLSPEALVTKIRFDYLKS